MQEPLFTESTAAASEAYKASRFNVYLRGERGRVLIFNSLSRVFANLKPGEWEGLRAIHRTGRPVPDDDLMSHLLRSRFIVARDIDEFELFRVHHHRVRFESDALMMTVAPTLGCNFGCDYCFQTHHKPRGRMAPAVVDAIHDHVRRRAAKLKRLSICWYGGEPFMAWDIMRDLSARFVALSREHTISYNAMAVTNGSLLTPPRAAEFDELGLSVLQVTLDGPPENHDRRRPFAGGRPSFRRILDNLARVRPVTRAFISIRINMDARNAANLFRLIDILGDAGLTVKNRCSAYFAPVEAITPDCRDAADYCLPRPVFAEREMELLRYAVARGVSHPPYPGAGPGNCAAVRENGLVVIPNGDMFKCWDEVNYPHRRIGNITEPPSTVPNVNLQRWMTWKFSGPCARCRVLPLCVGGCPLKTIHRDEVAGVSRLPCNSYRYTVKRRLHDFAVARGAVSANGESGEQSLSDFTASCG